MFMLLAGGAFLWVSRKKDDEGDKANNAPPPIPAPEIELLPSNFQNQLPPNDFMQGTTGNTSTPTTTTTGSTPPLLLNAQHPTVVARRAQLASDYANNRSTSDTIKSRYQIGAGLFDGISNAAAILAIKQSISKLFTNLQLDNLMQYPVHSKYTHPELRSNLQKIVEQFPNGVYFTAIGKTAKMDISAREIGFLESIHYNLFTGRNVKSEFTEPENAYFVKSNGLASADGRGEIVILFAKNWIKEIDKFTAALEREATNKMLHQGWRIEGFSAPFADEV